MSDAPVQVPPHSEESEAGIIGSILAEPDCMHEVRAALKISPAMMYNPKHELVLEAMYELADSGSVVDTITLQTWLQKKNRLDDVGGLTGLLNFIELTPTSTHVRHYAAIVREKYRLRRFIGLMRHGLQRAYHEEDTQKIVSQTANELHDITADQLEAPRSNLEVFDHLMAQWELAHQRRMSKESVPLPGLATPFGRLNELLGGWQPGLHFVAAPPSAGKTSGEGQITEFTAMTAGPVLKFYLDDTQDDAIGRLASRHGGVSLPKLQHGHATKDDLDKLREDVRPIVENIPIFIREDVETVQQIQHISRLYKAKYGIVLITIDYVQIVDTDSETRWMQERDRLAQVCSGLKRLWKELRLPIVVLSQVQRENYKEDANPRQASMAELFGAAVLEHTASSVHILKKLKADDVAPQPIDRDGYSFKDPVAWHVVKNKHGPLGMVPLWFYKKYFRFEQTPTKPKGNVVYYMDWKEHIEHDRQLLEQGR